MRTNEGPPEGSRQPCKLQEELLCAPKTRFPCMFCFWDHPWLRTGVTVHRAGSQVGERACRISPPSPCSGSSTGCWGYRRVPPTANCTRRKLKQTGDKLFSAETYYWPLRVANYATRSEHSLQQTFFKTHRTKPLGQDASPATLHSESRSCRRASWPGLWPTCPTVPHPHLRGAGREAEEIS